MGAAFDQLALIHDQDHVSLLDGRQAVGDDQRGTAFHHMIQRCLDMPLGLGIQDRSCFIENQQRSVLEQGPGNSQALALAAGQQHTVLTHLGIETLG
ncbi:hypothetical protein D1872_308590 [compost metagenome]